MYDFQLYRTANDNFPTEINVDGIIYPINTDYRIILKIFRVQERLDISQSARNIKTLELFYKGNYPQDNPFEIFTWFVSRCRTPEPSDKPPVMDYFFDADVIYLSVKKQYGIDLLQVPYMHWYEFLMLVESLGGDTPLQERIRIRTADLSDYKGDDLVNLRKAKKRLAIPQANAQLTESEQASILKRFGV